MTNPNIDFVLVATPDNTAFPDERVALPPLYDRAEFSIGTRGIEEASVRLTYGTYTAFALYQRLGRLRLEAWQAGRKIFTGRADVEITRDGVEVRAFAPWDELNDVLYSGFWSSRGMQRLERFNNAIGSSSLFPELYEWFEDDDQIIVSPIKGVTYDDTTRAAFGLNTEQYDTTFTAFQFEIEYLLPDGWSIVIDSYDSVPLSGFTRHVAIVSTGSAEKRAGVFTGLTKRIVFVQIIPPAASDTAPGETGTWYVRLNHLRVVRDTTYYYSQATTGAITAGSSVTIPVPTTVGLYAGAEVLIDASGATAEVAIITSVPTSTTFVVDVLDSNHSSGAQIRSLQQAVEPIVAGLLTYITGINDAGALQSSSRFVEENRRDVIDGIYDNVTPADIIADFEALGDGSSPWEAGCEADGTLYFRPIALRQETWVVDAIDISLAKSIANFVNAVRGRYKDLQGAPVVTDLQKIASSLSRFNIERQGLIDVDTQAELAAEAVALFAAGQTAFPLTEAAIVFDRVYTEDGRQAILTQLRPNDILKVRNLPVLFGTEQEANTRFTIKKLTFDAMDSSVRVTLDTAYPDSSLQQAAVQRNAEIAASLSGAPAAYNSTVLRTQQLRRSNPKQTTGRSSQFPAGSSAPVVTRTNSFTPTVRGSTTAGTYGYTRQDGIWVWNGDYVWIEIDMILSSITSAGTGNLQVVCSGLPPAPLSFRGSLQLIWLRFFAFTNFPTVLAMNASGALILQFQDAASGGGGSFITPAALSATTHMIITGHYRVK
jgi:hypothetical protein